MDDIIEKLSLLDYENAFCKGWKHKRISRVYFAHPPLNDDEENQRIHCLYDMIYWLMSLNKEMVSHFNYILYHLILSIKLYHVLIFKSI
jgi:hypothetical protein